MYKLGLIIIAAIAWSTFGCGGPGAPVNRASELRDRTGGGAVDNSAPGPGRGLGRGQGRQGQEKGGDEAVGGDGEAAESPDETKSDESDSDEANSDDAKNSEAESKEPEAKEMTAAEKMAQSNRRRGRPEGLGRASGGGGANSSDKDKDNEDDLSSNKREREQPDRPGDTSGDSKDETAPALVDNELQVEKHRFTFFERANYAFSTENETEGFQYLYAHAIAEENALSEHPIAWYTGINEPRLALRWGVGVDYRPGSFDGDPPKFDIEDESSAAAAGAGGRGSNTGDIGGRDISDRLPGGANRPGSQPSVETPTEQLVYYTGDFGELLLQRIEVRRTNPDYYWGKALYDIDATKVIEVTTSAPDNRFSSNRGNRNRDNRRGGGTNLSNEDPGANPPVDPGNSEPANDNDRRLPPPEIPGFEPEFRADPTSLVPGAITLGLGDRDELLARARAHGLDLLAVFDVSIQVSSRGESRNITMLTIINVKTGEDVAKTRKLNSVAYWNALDSGKENPIELELDKLFPEATDKEYKCSPLPNISSEAASRRVDSLLENKTDNPLPILAEIKYYLDNDLISKEEYAAAAETLIGSENARKLVDGDIEEREEALHDWLPGQYSVNTGNSTGFR